MLLVGGVILGIMTIVYGCLVNNNRDIYSNLKADINFTTHLSEIMLTHENWGTLSKYLIHSYMLYLFLLQMHNFKHCCTAQGNQLCGPKICFCIVRSATDNELIVVYIILSDFCLLPFHVRHPYRWILFVKPILDRKSISKLPQSPYTIYNFIQKIIITNNSLSTKMGQMQSCRLIRVYGISHVVSLYISDKHQQNTLKPYLCVGW